MMTKETRVLLLASNILGNATASRRFMEALRIIPNLTLEMVSVSQSELDEVNLPFGLNKFQAIKTYWVTRRKLWVLRQENFDVVLCITSQPLLALHGLFKQARIAMWFDALPIHPEKGLRGWLLNAFGQFIYNLAFKRVNVLLPMSQWAKKQITDFRFPSADKTAVCYVGVLLDKWRRPQLGCAKNKSPTRVLTVSNDARRKGLIDFFSHIKNNAIDISAYQFVVVTNEKNSQLLSLAQDLGIQMINDITHDSLDRLIAEYHQADIFFLPTKADMLPNVLIEATAAGLPIVASDIGAINEVVEDGVNGRLVKSGDWQGFLQALDTVRALPRGDHPAILEKFSDAQFCRVIASAIS
jgi:glycosyltransferase involved in cell wall biosynthesis